MIVNPSTKRANDALQGKSVRLSRYNVIGFLVVALVLPYVVARLFFAIAIEEPAEKSTKVPHIITATGFQHATVSENLPRGNQYGASYHEAFVHPAMLVNGRSRQRVAIVGDGEGFLLREVLKHKTVTTCAVIDRYGELVEQARTHLPESIDCSDFLLDKNATDNHTSDSCFDDPRAEFYSEDPSAWFLNRYGEGEEIDDEVKFDVIILDSIDPSALADGHFIAALVNALEENQGVLVMQSGEHTHQSDLLHLVTLERLLKANGMYSMKSYYETRGREFRIAFMESSLSNFYRDAALVELDLVRRGITTKSGRRPFQYFDGATMALYQYPSRDEEKFFCKTRFGDWTGCHSPRGFDPGHPVLPESALEVKASSVPNAGRGVFLKEDATAGSYFTLEQNIHNMNVMPETLWVANNTLNFIKSKGINDQLEVLIAYTHGYGFYHEFYGGVGVSVDAGIATFVNHGCNGSYVIGARTPIDEIMADPYELPEFMLVEDARESAFYNPLLDRNHFVHIFSKEQFLVDAKAGDEVLSNYLDYLDASHWTEQVLELKAECLESKGGSIFNYDTTKYNNMVERSQI